MGENKKKKKKKKKQRLGRPGTSLRRPAAQCARPGMALKFPVRDRSTDFYTVSCLAAARADLSWPLGPCGSALATTQGPPGGFAQQTRLNPSPSRLSAATCLFHHVPAQFKPPSTSTHGRSRRRCGPRTVVSRSNRLRLVTRDHLAPPLPAQSLPHPGWGSIALCPASWPAARGGAVWNRPGRSAVLLPRPGSKTGAPARMMSLSCHVGAVAQADPRIGTLGPARARNDGPGAPPNPSTTFDLELL